MDTWLKCIKFSFIDHWTRIYNYEIIYPIQWYKYCENVNLHLELHQDNITRGHSLKLVYSWCHYDLRTFSVSVRFVNIWNSLPASVISANNVNTFNNRLDRLWTNQELLLVTYNYESSFTVIVEVQLIILMTPYFSFMIVLCAFDRHRGFVFNLLLLCFMRDWTTVTELTKFLLTDIIWQFLLSWVWSSSVDRASKNCNGGCWLCCCCLLGISVFVIRCKVIRYPVFSSWKLTRLIADCHLPSVYYVTLINWYDWYTARYI